MLNLENAADDELDFGALPAEVNRLLQRGVAAHFTDPAQAEVDFRAAIALMPAALPAYRCLFKHYNRRRQFEAAYAVVLDWLAEAARQAALPPEWQLWRHAPTSALAALKGLAFIELRRGHPEVASAAIGRVLQLDPHDGVGGSVVAALLPEAA